MKNVKLQLLLKSRSYRQMCFEYIKARLLGPFFWVSEIGDLAKLYIDYPDKWQREARIREMERNHEIEEKKIEKVVAYIHFVEVMSRVQIFVLMNCCAEAMDVMPQSLQTEFAEIKAEFQKWMNQLEKMGVSIPKELKLIFDSIDIEKMIDLKEYGQFSSQIYESIDTIAL